MPTFEMLFNIHFLCLPHLALWNRRIAIHMQGLKKNIHLLDENEEVEGDLK